MPGTVIGEPSTARQGAVAEDRAEPRPTQLHGKVGTTSIVLAVVAYLAPLGAAAGYVPFIIGYGNGLGAPYTFLLCGVVVTLFSFGYLAMVRQVPRPGAFYAFISAGLGKRIGLGSGALTLTFYLLTSVGFYLFGAVSLKTVAHDDLNLGGPWWIYALIQFVVVAWCSYRGIDFNTRVMGVIVAVELSLMMIFNVVTLIRGGSSGLSTKPLEWSSFTSGSIAVAVLFAIAFFVGFESTAIFREEARNPVRTIPRATWIVVGVISLFYFLTAFCFIAALGTDDAVSITAANPAGSFRLAAGAMVGHAFSQGVAVLVVTSVMTANLAMATVTTRYFYSLGVDRVLPRGLAAVHRKYQSPHRAAVVTNMLTILGVVTVAVAGLDAQKAYGIFSGVLEFGFEVLVLLVSSSVIVYFLRHRGTGETVWSTLVAPLLTVAAFGWLLYQSFDRSDVLLGTPTPLTPVLVTLLAGAFVAGLGFASWAAIRKRDVFVRIGRADS